MIHLAQRLSVSAALARARAAAALRRAQAGVSAAAAAQAGRMNIIGIIGAVCILIFYMINPEPINHFMQWVINTFLEAVRDAFGTSDDGGAKDSGQIRTKHGPG